MHFFYCYCFNCSLQKNDSEILKLCTLFLPSQFSQWSQSLQSFIWNAWAWTHEWIITNNHYYKMVKHGVISVMKLKFEMLLRKQGLKTSKLVSMTLTFNAHCCTFFRPKTNNQPIKKFLSLAVTWVKVVKMCKILTFKGYFLCQKWSKSF